MARCIPDVIPAAQHHDGEQALLERLRTELPDEFIVIPCLEVPHLCTGAEHGVRPHLLASAPNNG